MLLKFLETIVFVLKISLRLKTTRGRYLLSSKKNYLPHVSMLNLPGHGPLLQVCVSDCDDDDIWNNSTNTTGNGNCVEIGYCDIGAFTKYDCKKLFINELTVMFLNL